MKSANSSYETKQRIMDAAEKIVIQKGANHLTFDILVTETGTSKGGILYHYPNKRVLLRSMVQRMLAGFDHGRRRAEEKLRPAMTLADSPTEHEIVTKSYIQASFAKRDQASSTALMAAAANDPELLEVVREHFKTNFNEIRQMGNKSMLNMILFLAADGLWLLDALQLCPLTGTERQSLKEMMLKLADA